MTSCRLSPKEGVASSSRQTSGGGAPLGRRRRWHPSLLSSPRARFKVLQCASRAIWTPMLSSECICFRVTSRLLTVQLTRRFHLGQAGLCNTSHEPLPLKDTISIASELKMRIVAISGSASVSAVGSAVSTGTGSRSTIELHGSRQSGLRTCERPLIQSSIVFGEARHHALII